MGIWLMYHLLLAICRMLPDHLKWPRWPRCHAYLRSGASGHASFLCGIQLPAASILESSQMGGKHCKHQPRMIQMVGLLWFTMVYYGLPWFTMAFSTLDSDVELVLNGIQSVFDKCHPHHSTAALSLGFLQHPVLGSQATGLSPEPQSLEAVDRPTDTPFANSESRCAIKIARKESEAHAVNWRRPEKSWKYVRHESEVRLFWPWRLVKNHSTSHKICSEIHQKCCENAPATMISPWKSAEILRDSSNDSPRSAHRCCWAVGRVSEQRKRG